MDILQELEQTRTETIPLFDLDDTRLDLRYGPGKWSVRQVLHHLSDAETVLFDRIRRVISEPRPVIWAFDQDAWAERLIYVDRPLDLSRDIYDATRKGVMHYARIYYADSETVEFVHSETGLRTLREEFDKVALHNRQHLDQIRRALESGGS